jgi:hypothetical protein
MYFTQAGLNTWDTLLQPIQRYQPQFADMTDEAYLAEATRMAEEELIPAFMDKLADDIQVAGVDLSLVKLSLFSSTVSGNAAFETSLWGSGYANGLVQVVSFDMTLAAAGAELGTTIAATFMPSSWGYVYSNEEMIFVAGQGYDWSEEDQASGQTMYLVGFELTEGKAAATVTGSVPGYLLNPYSLDFHNGYLRIATTQSWWTMVMFDDMMRVAEEPVEMEGSLESSTTSSTRQKIATTEVVNDQGSSTENYVSVLKMPVAGTTEAVLQQVGSVKLGKPDEVRC